MRKLLKCDRRLSTCSAAPCSVQSHCYISYLNWFCLPNHFLVCSFPLGLRMPIELTCSELQLDFLTVFKRHTCKKIWLMKIINNEPVGCRLNTNYVYSYTPLIYAILISIYFIVTNKLQRRRQKGKLQFKILCELNLYINT